MKNKNKLIPIIMLGATVIVCLIGVIVILVTTLKSKYDQPVVFPTPTQTPVVQETVEPEPEEVPIEGSESPDRTERLAYLGDFIDCIDIEERELLGTVSGLKSVFSTATGKGEIASIEKLLSPYVKEVRLLTTELPKLYVGDKTWEFSDVLGNPGQIVRTEDKLYLFYYNDSLEDTDVVIASGFPATSYGYIQPAKDEFKENTLIVDFEDSTEAYRVLSALVDGENLPVYSSYYLINQSSFTRLRYFPEDMEVSCYRINQDLSETFVEVYLTKDRYYTILEHQSNYNDIIDKYLYRNNPDNYSTVTNSEEEEDKKTEFTLDDFRDAKVGSYVWDGKQRELWEAVIKTSSKDDAGEYVPGNVQQILQYALERHNITSCELIGETAFINSYAIVNNNVFAVQLTTGTSSTTDYYIGISEASGSAVILPADAMPKE